MAYMYLHNLAGEIFIPITYAKCVKLQNETLQEMIDRLYLADIVLVSPSGYRFKLKVSDTGELSTEKLLWEKLIMDL